MSNYIELEREDKIMLLQVLKRGYWLPEDIEKLPSKDAVLKRMTNKELIEKLDDYHRCSGSVCIDESLAKKLAQQGLLDFDGTHYDLTERAREYRKALL